MKRVLVLGSPGAGKSFFSRKLAELTKLPLIHMDNLYWNKNKVSISREELIEKLNPIIQEDEWIIDGNYHHTLNLRLERCTDIFFLDLPREDCVQGMIDRIGVVRDDIPWVESKEDAEELIEWTKDYETKTRPLELQLLSEHPDVHVTVFYTREEINRYLDKLNEKV